MVKISDVLATAWMVKVLRREVRRDKELIGSPRAAVLQSVAALDNMRELMAVAVKQRRARSARKRG